jgi:hypothetical protein
MPLRPNERALLKGAMAGSDTYESYLADTEKEALDFLNGITVSGQQYYVVVEVPGAVVAKDQGGVYRPSASWRGNDWVSVKWAEADSERRGRFWQYWKVPTAGPEDARLAALAKHYRDVPSEGLPDLRKHYRAYAPFSVIAVLAIGFLGWVNVIPVMVAVCVGVFFLFAGFWGPWVAKRYPTKAELAAAIAEQKRGAPASAPASPASAPSTTINPVTGNMVLDLVPESEKRDAVRAQRSLDGDNEEYARTLCELLTEFRSQAEEEKYRRGAEIARIGKELDKDGGFQRMRLVNLRVRALGGDARLLELAWDGIGQWLG